jgi:hypothetical protein
MGIECLNQLGEVGERAGQPIPPPARGDACSLLAARAFLIAIDALPSGALFWSARRRRRGRLAIRWIEVDAASDVANTGRIFS